MFDCVTQHEIGIGPCQYFVVYKVDKRGSGIYKLLVYIYVIEEWWPYRRETSQVHELHLARLIGVYQKLYFTKYPFVFIMRFFYPPFFLFPLSLFNFYLFILFIENLFFFCFLDDDDGEKKMAIYIIWSWFILANLFLNFGDGFCLN